jgi:hypothetical protein
MASTISTDLILGVSAIGVAIIVVYMFVRATSSGRPQEDSKEGESPLQINEATPQRTGSSGSGGQERLRLTQSTRALQDTDVERARSNLRTLTLKQEILSVIMKRLFEAEDDGEITREERIRLSTEYEKEIKEVQEELKKSELIVSLSELESIRDDIIKKFESTLNSTQQKIDMIIKELKIKPVSEIPEPEPEPKTTRRPEPETVEEEEEEEDEEEREEQVGRRRPSNVDERLNRLKEEVLKELEELDRLELES